MYLQASWATHWLQVVVITADLERMLGRFDAAMARLDAAQDQVPPNSPYRAAIEQIHFHAETRNAEAKKVRATAQTRTMILSRPRRSAAIDEVIK
jgi:hypothetical protein